MRVGSLFVVAALAGILALADTAGADEQSFLELRLAQMEDKLELSPEQSAQVRQILDQTFAQIGVLQQELKGDPQALGDAVGKELRNANNQIEDLLTDQQKERFREFKRTGRADIRTFQLQEQLGLTEEQTGQVHGILVESERYLIELRDKMSRQRESGGRGGGGFGELRKLMEDTHKRIEKVLTDQQKETYKEMVEERRSQMRDRMGGRGGRGRGGFGRP
jgi:hypothetical protein